MPLKSTSLCGGLFDKKEATFCCGLGCGLPLYRKAELQERCYGMTAPGFEEIADAHRPQLRGEIDVQCVALLASGADVSLSWPVAELYRRGRFL